MNCTEPLFIRFYLVRHAEDVVGRGVIEPRKGHNKPRRHLSLARLIVAVYPLIYTGKSGDLFFEPCRDPHAGLSVAYSTKNHLRRYNNTSRAAVQHRSVLCLDFLLLADILQAAVFAEKYCSAI